MRIFTLVALLAASTCWAQESNPPPPPSPTQARGASERQTITIPTGTRIPLALAGPISTKARQGSPVRAVTGFPVTVGTQLAIPVGTYVEGVIDKVTPGGRSGPSLQMHFTRILYANGYGVAIDGANTQAKALSPKSSPSELAAFDGEAGPNYALAAASSPQLPTVQPPHTGTLIGLAVAGAVGAVAIAILAHYHHGSTGVLFDTGWQFEMVLESPLSVDLASIAAATPGAP